MALITGSGPRGESPPRRTSSTQRVGRPRPVHAEVVRLVRGDSRKARTDMESGTSCGDLDTAWGAGQGSFAVRWLSNSPPVLRHRSQRNRWS